MPIYEYKCDLCNCLWEEIQNFSDPVLTICKGCEEEGGVHKLFSGQIAFHLKGTGWYKDGYGDKRAISKEEKIERSTLKTTSTNTETGESKVVSEKPLDPKTPVARSLVDD